MKFFQATAILIGTAIGAGIFAIPYAISKIGFWPLGVLYIFVLGVVVILTTLAYGEVVLRTQQRKQMTGYAKLYLGGWAKKLLTFSLGFGIFGALIAYTIGVGEFLSALLSPSLGGTPFGWGLLFFALASLAVFRGLKTVALFEGIMVFFLILLVLIVLAVGLPYISLESLTTPLVSLQDIFLSYGVILFAFGAAAAVPDMVDILGKKKGKLRKAIILGMLVPLLIYFLFSLVVVGITGPGTTEEAIIGLGGVLGRPILILGALFGILTMSSSFLILGLVLKEIFWYDYNLPHFLSWFLVIILPLVVFILGLTSFAETIGIAGAVMGGFEGILILLMWKSAKEKGERPTPYSLRIPSPIVWILIFVFGLGILYQVYYLLF